MRLECEHCGWKGDFQEAGIEECSPMWEHVKAIDIRCPRCKHGVVVGVRAVVTRTIVCEPHVAKGYADTEWSG